MIAVIFEAELDERGRQAYLDAAAELRPLLDEAQAPEDSRIVLG